MIQPVSEHPRNRQSPPIVMMSMSCSHFIFLRKNTKCANNPILEYSCFEKKINLRIVYGREFFSNWEKNNILRKKWDFRVFLVWDLFDGQGAWIDGIYQNFLYIQHYFLQIFNSIKPDNLKYYEMLAGPVKIYWVRFEKAYFDKKKIAAEYFLSYWDRYWVKT